MAYTAACTTVQAVIWPYATLWPSLGFEFVSWT